MNVHFVAAPQVIRVIKVAGGGGYGGGGHGGGYSGGHGGGGWNGGGGYGGGHGGGYSGGHGGKNFFVIQSNWHSNWSIHEIKLSDRLYAFCYSISGGHTVKVIKVIDGGSSYGGKFRLNSIQISNTHKLINFSLVFDQT